MAKKKKNYNLILYELQQEAVRNAAITGGKVSNSELEKQAQDEYLAPIKNANPARKAAQQATYTSEAGKRAEQLNRNAKTVNKDGSTNRVKASLQEISRNIVTGAKKVGNFLENQVIEPIGDFGQNYKFGKLTEDLGMEAYKKMMGEDNKYDEFKREYDEFLAQNPELTNDAQLLDQTIQTLPNQVGALLSGIKGGGIGATIGATGGAIIGGVGAAVGTAGTGTAAGATAGATAGAKWLGGAGYVTGSADYTYKLEAGLQYQTLIEMGVPEDIAKEESKDTGAINALIEGGESILDLVTLGGVSAIKGTLTKGLVKKYGEKTVAKWVGENVVKNAISEGIEEAAQESVSIHNEKQAMEQAGLERDDSQDAERIIQSGIAGGFAGGVIGGGTAVVSGTTKVGINTIQNKNQNETQIQGLQQEIAKKTEELNKSQDAREKQIIQDTINGLNEELNELTNAQQITDEKELRKQRFTYEAQENDSKYKRRVYESAAQHFDNTETTHKFIDAIANIAEERGTIYEFTTTEEIKQGNHNVGDNIIDGFTQDGKVVINVDSPKFLNVILGHETTHLLENKDKNTGEYSKEYKALKQIAIEYAKTKGDYDARIERLTKLYEGTDADIEAELTSDIVGEYLFTDYNFVKELSVKQPTIFEKIRNFISDLVVKFKGTAQEKQLRQLQRTFEKAYKAQGTQTSTDTKYLITRATDEQIEEVRRLEGEGKTNAEIYLETGAYRGAEDRIKTEIDDSKSEVLLDKSYIEKGDTFKLREILKHNKLYKAYPKLKSIDVKFAELEGNLLGKYNPNNDTIELDVTLYNQNENSLRQINEFIQKIEANDPSLQLLYTPEQLKIIEDAYRKELQNNNSTLYQFALKSTLMHEIQHYIQQKEGFAKGNSVENVEKIKKNYNEHLRNLNKELVSYTDEIGISEWINENVKRVQSGEITIDEFFKEQEDFKLNSKYGKEIETVENDIKNYKRRYGVWDRDAYDLYENTAGEIEAREVQKRLKYTKKERKNEIPFISDENTIYQENGLNIRKGIIKYSLSTTDNQGRTLTKEQQEYFKDSKVRDENGNLLTVYHGTNADFNVFKRSKKGYLGGTIYFTDDIEKAKEYTDYGMVKEGYVNIKNPLVITSANAPKEILRVIYGNDSVYNRRTEKQAYVTHLLTSTDMKKLTNMGYDGIAWKFGGETEYAVFDSNQFKNVDNTNPTTDPDIRYSLSEETQGEYNYQSHRPKVRGGWTIEKIQRQLKTESSYNKPSVAVMDYTDIDEFKNNVYYHGSANFHNNLKAGSTIGEDFRGGGYGEEYHSISLSRSKNRASTFTGTAHNGVVTPVLLRKGANVIEMTDIEDSIELEDMLPELWEQKVDAVKIGDWDSEYSEQEIVILNPKAITVLGDYAEHYPVYHKPKFENMSNSEIQEMYSHYQEKYNNLHSKTNMSLSAQNEEIAPTGQWNVRGEDIKLQVEEAIAPLQETIANLTEQVQTLQENIVPTAEQYKEVQPTQPTLEEVQNLIDIRDNKSGSEYARAFFALRDKYGQVELYKSLNEYYSTGTVTQPSNVENIDTAPVSQEVVEKQGQEAFNHITDEQAPSWEDAVFEAMDSGDFEYSSTEHIPSPLDSRDIDEVGNRKVKAYQYENPEVKPFFQAEAQNMLYDLDNTIKGEKGAAVDELGNYQYYGITRQTTEAIAYLKDNYGYSYDQIRQGLNKIIEDDGKENNAVSKRIEFMLDERLREGYTTSDGIPIPANEDYINFLNEKQVTEYNKEAFNAITDEDMPLYETIEPLKSSTTRENTPSQQTTSMKIKTAQNGNTGLTETVLEPELVEGKKRRWVGTSTESEVVNREVLPDDLDYNAVYYQPITNKDTLNTANARLDGLGYEESIKYFKNKILDKRTTVEDIALGERLIQEAIKKGDTKTAGDIIQDVAILGTELGQKVQALSIIQRMTPEGQLKMLEKTINRGKTKGDQAFTNVKLTDDMKKKILDTYNKDGSYDQNKLNKAVDEVKQQIADQMPSTLMDKVNAWRYLSMLGNPKTHIRNLVSNVAMKGTVAVKNAVARTVETIAPIKNRTKTWKAASDDVINFAKQTTLEMKDVISGDSKYSESTDIKAKREIFKNKVLEKMANLNSDLLEKEDWWFSKGAFESSFREFLTANGITTQEDIQNNPELIEKGKNYAVEQAQIATFRQYSWLANKIRDIENRNAATQIAVGAVLPFKKTPINIAKTGLSYSPIGALKSLTYDLYQVGQGKMEASQAIDNIAQGVTGTALTLIGYMLAQAGLVNGAGDDDKESKYDYQLGKQAYSLNIGGKTYSISWLSPVAMPLLVGANFYEQLIEKEEWNADVVLETLGQTLDPLSEMSFLSSFTDVLSSYEQGDMRKLFSMFEAMGQNYATQFIPTVSSQLAATLDDTKRTTKVAGDSTFKQGEELYNKLIYKIPYLRETLEPTTDIWGNEVKQSEDLFTRAFENFIAPYARKDSIATEIDEELKDLYSQTGDNGILPSIPYNYVNYDGEKYKMSAEEYTDYKKMYGQTANDLLEDLFRTTTYQRATSEERADMVNDVYDYARDESNLDYLAKEGVDYKNAKEEGVEVYKENLIKGAVENDMTTKEYGLYLDDPEEYEFLKEKDYEYRRKYFDTYDSLKELDESFDEQKDGINDDDELDAIYSEKKAGIVDKIINSGLDDTEKASLYKRYYNSDTVDTIMKSAISIDDYLIYETKEFKADKNAKGNSIPGSRKDKVINYVNTLDMEIGQKAILIKSTNTFKFNDYNVQIVRYLDNLGLPYDDFVSILNDLDMTVKGDTVYWE